MSTGGQTQLHDASDGRRWRPLLVLVGAVGLAVSGLLLGRDHTVVAVFLGLASAFNLASGFRPARRERRSGSGWTREVLAQLVVFGGAQCRLWYPRLASIAQVIAG